MDTVCAYPAPNNLVEVRSVPLKLRPTETVEDKGHRSVDL
jgi:hypothetical protein